MSQARRAEQSAEVLSIRVYLKLLNPADFARKIITNSCSWTRPNVSKAALSTALFAALLRVAAADLAAKCAVIDATKIIEDYRRFFASFWPGIFRISAKNLPLLSLRPSLTVGMTKIPKIPGLFHYFFCWILRNLPTEPTSSEKTQETNNYRHNEIGTSRGG